MEMAVKAEITSKEKFNLRAAIKCSGEIKTLQGRISHIKIFSDYGKETKKIERLASEINALQAALIKEYECKIENLKKERDSLESGIRRDLLDAHKEWWGK